MNNVWMSLVFVVIGLVLILVGANALTDGAAAVAKRFRISNLVVALTITFCFVVCFLATPVYFLIVR